MSKKPIAYATVHKPLMLDEVRCDWLALQAQVQGLFKDFEDHHLGVKIAGITFHLNMHGRTEPHVVVTLV